MTRVALFAVSAVLAFAMAVPAFATGTGGTGAEFGKHHATHAKDMGGFTSEMNPGNHRGFSGWMAE